MIIAKLGANVRSAGAIGTDAAGHMLLSLLEQQGIDTSLLRRRSEVQTSASVLPIRPNGDRPAFHVVGANGTFTPDDVDWDAVAATDFLHLGGPEFIGGEAALPILEHARTSGAVTSADILAPGDPGLLEWIAPCFPGLDYLLPNDEQVLGFTGESDLVAGCRALVDRGVGASRRRAGRRRRDRRLRVGDRSSGVRDRGRRHHRLRRRVLRRLLARPPLGRDRATRRCSAARRRRSSLRAWAPTMVSTTSRPRTSFLARQLKGLAKVSIW